MIDLSKKYPKLSFSAAVLLFVLQLLILLECIFKKAYLFEMISRIDILPTSGIIIAILIFLIGCFLLAIYFVKNLLYKVFLLSLTLINFIWYIYYLYLSFDIGSLPLV